MNAQQELREALADYAHEAWTRWMVHLFSVSATNKNGSVTIPRATAERWMRLIKTLYADLREIEKDSDRKEADRMIEIVNKTKK
jgi:hypothetical protein